MCYFDGLLFLLKPEVNGLQYVSLRVQRSLKDWVPLMYPVTGGHLSRSSKLL